MKSERTFDKYRPSREIEPKPSAVATSFYCTSCFNLFALDFLTDADLIYYDCEDDCGDWTDWVCPNCDHVHFSTHDHSDEFGG